MKSSVRGWWVGGWVSIWYLVFAIWSSAVWWPARRSFLAFCWFWSWCCGTVCLMVAARRLHGSGGRNLWWSSMLSSHIAGCKCPGGREAHLRWFAGPSELFYAGLSGWVRYSSRTRQRCSQSGCSPQCNCRTVWGFLSSDRISSVPEEEETFLITVWIVQVSSSVMFTLRNLMLLTSQWWWGGTHWSASWNPPPAPWSY